MNVILSAPEIRYATYVGGLRERWGRKMKVVDQSGPQLPAGRRPDYIGALGEMAAHKWLGLYWAATVDGPEQTGDVLNWIEVKATAHAQGRLLQSPLPAEKVAQKLDRPFLLVTWADPVATLVGWMFGRDFLVPAHFGDNCRTGRPNWAVTQATLRHPDELLHLAKARI